MSENWGPLLSVVPVSVDKLEFNDLSDDVATLLMAGRVKEKLVEDLLIKWPDPECIFRSIPISHFGIIRSPISV
ncbi:hypothetical protein HYN79_11670 [Vibrio parahaemolyticus]|nr:hypothetical protein [Vibrio parahaemolyticus]